MSSASGAAAHLPAAQTDAPHSSHQQDVLSFNARQQEQALRRVAWLSTHVQEKCCDLQDSFPEDDTHAQSSL